MRGGASGGRGRGRFGGKQSATQDLIRDNMEDLGIDVFGGGFGDREPPSLFPLNDFEITLPSPITEDDKFGIEKMRHISSRFQASPYFLSRKVVQDDIIRYSDKYKSNKKKLSLLDYINTSTEDATRYIPTELLDGRILGSRNDSNKRSQEYLSKLESAEAGGSNISRNNSDGKKVNEDGSDVEGFSGDDEAEFEGDDDYGVDHYASDDGGGGDMDDDDDGNEATY